MRALPRLRKHTAKLVGYCREGLTWAEMQSRLEGQGTHAALSSIHSYCRRHGYTRLHPGSQDYDPNTARLWEAGQLSLADLKPKNNPHPTA
jgi:hypothetical protein